MKLQIQNSDKPKFAHGLLNDALSQVKHSIEPIKQAFGFSSQIKTVEQKMNYQNTFPASEQEALRHKKASKFQRKNIKSTQNLETHRNEGAILEELIEPKVFKHIDQEFSFCSLIGSEGSDINSGISLLFYFVQWLMLYLLIRLTIVDGYNMFSSLNQGNFCQENQSVCHSFFVTKASALNKINRKDLILPLDILSFVMVVLSIPFFLIYRIFQENLHLSVEKDRSMPQNYTLFVENIPIVVSQIASNNRSDYLLDYHKQLQTVFRLEIQNWKSQIQTKTFPIGSLEQDFLTKILKPSQHQLDKQNSAKILTSINLCYDLKEYLRIRQLKEKIADTYETQEKEQLHRSDVQGQTNSKILTEIKRNKKIRKQMETFNKLQLSLAKNFIHNDRGIFKVTHFLGCAFVSFQYMHYMQHIIESAKKDDGFLRFANTDFRLKVSYATGPKDVLWQNLGVLNDRKQQEKLRSVLFFAIALAFAFVVVISIVFLETFYLKNKKTSIFEEDILIKVKEYALITLVPFTTILFNKILSFLIFFLVRSENYANKSDYVFDLISKLVVSQFINTTVIYLVISILLKSHFLAFHGLVIQVNLLVLISGIYEIILGIVGWDNLKKNIGTWWKYRNLFYEDDRDQVKTVQSRLNRDYQYPEFDTAGRYTYYLVQTYTVFFYSYIAPTCIPLLAVLFALQYWIDEYNLFKRSTCTLEFGYALSRKILRLFEFSILIFAIGNLTFSLYLPDENHYDRFFLNLGAVIIAGGYILLTMASAIFDLQIFSDRLPITSKTYSESRRDFEGRYWTENPATYLLQEKKQTGYNVDDDFERYNNPYKMHRLNI